MAEFVTAIELAERWQCQPTFILNMLKLGKLPGYKFGALIRIKMEDVLQYEAEHGDRPTRPKCIVYVIRAGDYIKIGKATNLARRLFSLQHANPVKLEVVAVISDTEDGHALEQELHRHFSAHRERGEWFRYEGALAAWIECGCNVVPTGTVEPALVHEK